MIRVSSKFFYGGVRKLIKDGLCVAAHFVHDVFCGVCRAVCWALELCSTFCLVLCILLMQALSVWYCICFVVMGAVLLALHFVVVEFQ